MKCPTCSKALPLSTCLHGKAKPSPGDFSLCIGCGDILVFSETMDLRIPMIAELMNLDQETSDLLDHAQRLIREGVQS